MPNIDLQNSNQKVFDAQNYIYFLSMRDISLGIGYTLGIGLYRIALLMQIFRKFLFFEILILGPIGYFIKSISVYQSSSKVYQKLALVFKPSCFLATHGHKTGLIIIKLFKCQTEVWLSNWAFRFAIMTRWWIFEYINWQKLIPK